MTLLTILAWLLLVPVAVPGFVFLTEVLLGLLPARHPATSGRVPRFAILMPAHDEGATIATFVRPLAASLPADARLLVVADNCADDTAAAACMAGAKVVERHDPVHRGKGYALDFGRAYLRGDPPEVVVVLDADCLIAAEDLARLAGAAAAGRPVQARYLFTGGTERPPMVQISNFALLVKNRVRQRGLARLGAPVILTGTGMAFPWAQFERARLATGDLVEDLALGLELTEAGTPPRFLDEAVVVSAPAGEGATLVQRTRWEHGFLDTARRHALPLLARSLSRGRPRTAWLAFHLMTPPLALLLMACAAATLLVGALAFLGASARPVVLLLALDLTLAAVVLAAWMLHGRRTLAAATLLRLPLYLAWKLPVYLGFVRRRETSWVRTDRAD